MSDDRRPSPFGRQVLTAPQQITAAIKESILDGSLLPGDRLPTEQEMASLFGVSRPTVREALRDLRAAHVVVSERGRTGGYRVAEVSVKALGTSVAEVISLSLRMQTLTYAQLFEVRLALEVLAAETAARRRTEEDLARLEAALPDVERLPEDPEEVVALDLGFHRMLAECSHNPLLIGFAGATATAFRRFSDDVLQISPNLVVAHLDEVAEAVRGQDPAAAREAIKRHLAYFPEYFGLDVLP